MGRTTFASFTPVKVGISLEKYYVLNKFFVFFGIMGLISLLYNLFFLIYRYVPGSALGTNFLTMNLLLLQFFAAILTSIFFKGVYIEHPMTGR